MRALRMAVLAAAACLASAACAPRRVAGVSDPAGARRFEIIAAGDSTFKFIVAGTRWLRNGDVGVVVDPRRRDVLVARFLVQRRVADTASALITGQTARVTPLHVALLDPPRARLLGQRQFWWGLLTGGLVGAGAAITFRR
jgi:hypothetical protein